MNRPRIPAVLSALPLGLVLVGVPLASHAASDDLGAPCDIVPEAPDDSAPPSTTAVRGERCELDAESYVLDYVSPMTDEDAAMVAPASATTGGAVSPGAISVSAEAVVAPLPPVLPDEPGFLDDNTFVAANQSPWVVTLDDRESTFALDVDTGSFSVAEAFVAEGYRPEPDSIRPEEWINSFDYGDPAAVGSALGVTSETGGGVGTLADPLLLRLGISTIDLSAEDRPPAHLTFVVDTSGSMDIRERLGMVQASLALLVRNLRADDTVAIVTYDDSARPLLDPTPVSEWRNIVDGIDSLAPGGSTNLEAGLTLGYELARESYDPDALNVVVLASDGVANAGVTDATELTDAIADAGSDGIHLVTVGYGMGNYNDHLMEQLANLGDGFYSYIDTFEQAVELFVTDLTPTLTVVAEQSKVQVVFDPEVVTGYRLVGYVNRMLDDSQFSNDDVDAGELGAGHRATAVYELELAEGVSDGDEIGVVRLRWEDPETGEVTELNEPILASTGEASDSLRFAALVGHTAEVLAGSEDLDDRGVTLDSLIDEANALAADHVPGAERFATFLNTLIHATEPVAATTELG